MPYEELLGWSLYFEERPVGWRDDDRTMKILQANGVKESADKLFASLAKIHNKAANNRIVAADGLMTHEDFRSSNLFAKLATAVGGDTLDIFKGNND